MEGEIPSPGGGIHDPTKGVAVSAARAMDIVSEEIICTNEIIRRAQLGLVNTWNPKRKALACKYKPDKSRGSCRRPGDSGRKVEAATCLSSG